MRAPFSFIKSSAVAWTPPSASLTTLAWFRADIGLTQSGGLATSWLNQGGGGDTNRNQSAAGAARPGFTASDASYGGKAVITGTGTQVFASGGAWSLTPNPPVTVIIIGETAATSAFVGDPTTTNMLYADASGHESVYGSVTAAQTGTVLVTSAKAFMFTDDGTGGAAAAKLYVNNFTTASSTFTTWWSTLSRLDMLSGFSGAYPMLTGKIAEVIVYRGIIAGTDLTNLRAYLNTTRAYGITVT